MSVEVVVRLLGYFVGLVGIGWVIWMQRLPAPYEPRSILGSARDLLGEGFVIHDERGEPLRLVGMLDGRNVKLELFSRTRAKTLDVRFVVEPRGKLPVGTLATAGPWPDTPSPHSSEGRDALERMRSLGIEQVMVTADAVGTTCSWPGSRWDDWVRALRSLATVTRALEVALPPPEVHVGAKAPGEAHALRCSYCHIDLTPDEPELIRCDRCGTVIHAGCREELGRCPVLGCEGRGPDRITQRI